MATAVVEDNPEAKADDLSSVYAEKLENINKIRGTLESLLSELDEHDNQLKSGFSEIQSLIGLCRLFMYESHENICRVCDHVLCLTDQQREKFKSGSYINILVIYNIHSVYHHMNDIACNVSESVD